MARRLLRRAALVVASALALPAGALAQFQLNTADIPGGSGNNSSSENVDFGDVDLDGDWDAVFADGGDDGNDQNRIWINQGNAQGGTLGVFVDRTSTQFPAVSDTSRDIEFADIDNDGDLDIYVSNTSTQFTQSNRWWVNQGLAQAGSVGFYTDETATRWVGLAGATTSIPSAAVLPGGGFKDWSCDCDFGDLDNDGDLDLVHSSYGGVFGGNVPTRLFLNDGNGFFSEFNPSGFKLLGDNIQNGNPGLWCEGTQQDDTMNADGTFCDVASSALDIDVGDVDGDFDLDILHGARQEAPRMFVNRLSETGTLIFRDVTGAVFPPNYTSGSGHYEQEMGDFDGDSDLDIYGLNWLSSGGLSDTTMRNTGGGVYDSTTILSGSGSDDNEGDCFDYDNDGDLDLFIASFSGQNRLYRNDWNGVPGGGGSFSFTNVTSTFLPSAFATALDADCCDVDDDGDYDVFVSNDNGGANFYLENTSQVPDTHAPYITPEKAPNRTAGPAPTVIRAQVYDNAPYYITWYNPTRLKVWVDGSPQPDVPMRSSGGQIFRGEVDGTLVGTIQYQIESEDRYGNVGLSILRTYVASPPGSVGVASCFGIGCPCGNDDPAAGCATSTGSGALLSGAGTASAAADDLVLTASGVAPSNQGLCYMGDSQVQNAFFDGFQCALGTTFRFLDSIQGSGASGTMSYTGVVTNSGLVTPGSTWHFHFWFRDVPGSPCGTGANLTNLLSVTFTP